LINFASPGRATLHPCASRGEEGTLLETNMTPIAFKRATLALCTGLALTACAGPQPAPYRDLATAPYLKPNPDDTTGKIPFAYSENTDWSKYRSILIEPVTIYDGPDEQFGKLPKQDRTALAQFMQTRFAQALAKRFTLVELPGSDTLRLKLVLTGASTTTPVLSTLSRFDMTGGIYNGVQAIRGQGGLLTGWVMYAAEIRDGSTGKLLEAFEAKQYPNAYNLPATFGSLAAARTGIDKGARMLTEQLQ
jgi:hypothetical protein